MQALPSSFPGLEYQPWRAMLGRVFKGHAEPHFFTCNINAVIQNDAGGTRPYLVGQFTEHPYKKYIRILADIPVVPDPTDFYAYVDCVKEQRPQDSLVLRIVEFVLKKIFFFLKRVKQMPVMMPNELPSTLFYGRSEGHKILCFLGEVPQQPLVLTLTTKAKKYPVETVLNELYHNRRELGGGYPVYLHKADMPKGILSYDQYDFSAQAKVFDLCRGGERSLRDVFDQAQDYPMHRFQFLSLKNGSDKKRTLEYQAPGDYHHLDVIVDHGVVLILGEENLPSSPQGDTLQVASQTKCKRMHYFPDEKIDLDSVKVMHIKERGILQIEAVFNLRT